MPQPDEISVSFYEYYVIHNMLNSSCSMFYFLLGCYLSALCPFTLPKNSCPFHNISFIITKNILVIGL